MSTIRRVLLQGLAGATAIVPAVLAQTPRVLAKPQVELSDPFTNVSNVRELSDGRLIVVDNGDQAVYLVDFTAGTSSQVGRPGGGPSEYRVPGMLLPIGDSTFLTDGGNRRLLVLSPDATPVAVLTDAWPQANGEPGTRLPRAVDARGRGYYIGRRGGPAPPTGELTQPDSASLMRSPRGSSAEELVGYIHMSPRRIATTTKDGKLATVNIIIPPYSAQDAWQVFADGAVAIVRVKDYRVDWLLPDGRHVAGQPIPFSPVRVTDRDKAAFDSARGRAATASTSSPPQDWPEFKPPFPWNEVVAGTDGRVWIPRYAPAGDRSTHYDVIDRRGVLAARVDVPDRGRIVGFGARSIYVVRKDADDLQYLRRFPLQN